MDVLTVPEMEQADRLAIAGGQSGFALMLRAGHAVADAAMDMAEDGPILVVAGRGNNGGDGFVAATELVARGREVSVILLCERETLKGDAALAAKGWKGPVLPCDLSMLGAPALIIDALFGAGLNRPVKGDPHAMIEAINANGAPVLSVDLPSGINGTTGAIMGTAVRATETVTFFRKKPAHLLLPGRIHCGRIRVADIGIDAAVLDEIRPATFENVADCWQHAYPVPRIDGHKYARGHALVVSGDVTSTGAARLSARGALRAGAGLVTVLSPGGAIGVNAAALTAVMVRRMDTAAEFADILTDRRLNACVVGPGAGIGDDTRALVLTALSAKPALVLDAAVAGVHAALGHAERTLHGLDDFDQADLAGRPCEPVAAVGAAEAFDQAGLRQRLEQLADRGRFQPGALGQLRGAEHSVGTGGEHGQQESVLGRHRSAGAGTGCEESYTALPHRRFTIG